MKQYIPRIIYGTLLAGLMLAAGSACAHPINPDPPLYEDLLFAELEKDKPKPKYTFPFDEMIEDELPVDHSDKAPGSPSKSVTLPPLKRAPERHWEQYLDGQSTQSIGKPNHGYLRNGRFLPRTGPGFQRKNDKAPYGTDEAVAIILWVCERMTELYPGTVPVVVGNLSKEGGGKLRPHASHQAGRDADLGYYFADNESVRHFKDANRNNLDVEKSWSLIELLLSTERVEYLFIDRSLQSLFYDEALQRGWAEEELRALFEAPVGEYKRHGIIRHSKGHRHHLHVRFKCAKNDDRCK
jgi:murein endopeptidase